MKNNFLKPIICTLIACMVLSTADCSSFEVKERNRNIGKIIYNELISEDSAEIPVYQSQNSDIACQKLITLNYLPDKNVNTYTVEVDNFHYNLYPEYPAIKRSDLPKDANGIDKDWIAVVITYGFTSKCGEILACEGAKYANGVLTLNIKYEKSNFEDLMLFMDSICFIFKKSDIPGDIKDIRLNVNAVEHVYDN